MFSNRSRQFLFLFLFLLLLLFLQQLHRCGIDSTSDQMRISTQKEKVEKEKEKKTSLLAKRDWFLRLTNSRFISILMQQGLARLRLSNKALHEALQFICLFEPETELTLGRVQHTYSVRKRQNSDSSHVLTLFQDGYF